MLNEVTNSKLRISEKEETVDMCKAIEDIRNDGRAEGRVEGRAEGRILGGLSMLCELVCDGLLTVAQAAAKAKVSEEQFRKQMEDAGYSRA